MTAKPEAVLVPFADSVVEPGLAVASVAVPPQSRLRDRLFLLAAGTSVLSLADQGVASTTSFLTGVLLGRTLSKEEFGLYMLGLTLVGLTSDLQACVVSTPYTIRSPRLPGAERARYSGSTLVHQLGIMLIFMLTISGAARFLASRQAEPHFVHVLAALGLAGGGTLLWYYTRFYLFANLRLARALLLDSLLAALQLGGLLALALQGGLTTPRAFGIIGIAGGLASTVMLLSARTTFRIDWGDVRSDFGKSWRSGRWILASTLVWSLGNQLYPWLLAAFHGTGAAGVWAACLGVVALVNPVFLGLQNSFAPRLAHAYAEGGPEGLRAGTWRALGTFALFVGPFAAGAVLVGGPAAGLLYGAQYAGTGAVVGTLGLNTLLLALSFPLSRALFVVERANLDLAINLLSLALMLSLGVFLVRSLGPLGAASTMLLGNAAGLLLRYAAFRSPAVRAR